MNKKIIACLCILASVIIMAMPVSLKMTFSSGVETGQKAVESFSYFSMIPAGYGNYMPLLTGCLSLCALISAVLNLKKNTSKQTMFILIACINLNLLSWFIFSAFTVPALIVFILEIMSFGFLKE